MVRPNNFAGYPEIIVTDINLNDRSSRVASVKTTNILLIVLVVVIVMLRLFSRLIILKNVFLEDVLIVCAAIATITLAGTAIAATKYGVGTHIWLFPLEAIFPLIKHCIMYLYVSQVLYACAIALTKLAIIASYFRFISDKTFRKIFTGVTIIVVALWITGVFVTIFQCTPVSAAWDFALEERECIDIVAYLYASSAINIATDILLCILPIPHLWALNLPVRQRIVLCILFAGGFGACIACTVRIAFLHKLIQLDGPFESALPLNLSVLECSLGIICISIPALRPLGRRLLSLKLWPHFLSKNGSKRIILRTQPSEATGTGTNMRESTLPSQASHT